MKLFFIVATLALFRCSHAVGKTFTVCDIFTVITIGMVNHLIV